MATGLVGRGVSQGQVGMMLSIYLASRRGEFASTDPTLERVLGRPAQTIQAFLKGVIPAR
jgi:hypothetical protein